MLRAAGSSVDSELVITPAVGSTSSASSNLGAIQAALDIGGLIYLKGSGVASLSGPLVIRSRTTLIVDRSLTLQQAAGVNGNVLVNAAYQAVASSVTVTWSSGITASVAKTAHGYSVGDYAFLSGTAGTTDSAFSGVFPVVSVTDADNFVVALRRAPSAAPSGTIACKAADVDITIEGGVWDFNAGSNTGTANTPEVMCCNLAGIAGLNLRHMRGKAATKFFINSGGLCNFRYEDIELIGGTSDIIKVYGPAWDGKINGVHGQSGDDMVSLQGQDFSPYDGYNISGWGDVLDIDVDAVDAYTSNLGSGCALYASPNQVMDNIRVRRITASCKSAASVNISGASGSGSGTMGRIKIEDCALRPDATQNLIGVSGTPTVRLLEVNGVAGPDALTSNNPSALSLTAGTFKTVVVSNVHWQRGTGGAPIYLGGAAINHIVVKNSYVYGNGSGGLVSVFGGAVKKLTVQDNEFDSCSPCVLVNTASAAFDVAFLRNHLNFCTQGLSTLIGINAEVTGNTVQGGITGGLVRVNGTLTANITSGGGNNGMSAGQWLVKVGGSEVVNLYAEDFQVDVTAVARVNGGKCFNTNTAAGTITSAGVVDCLGTAANSWHLRGTPTLVY